MTIYKLDKNNIPYVAGLMAEIKPEWWIMRMESDS